MTKIENKLQEANFFYDRMNESEIPFAFSCYLSAFLSASRSVLQYILEETKSKTGGRQWYDDLVSRNYILRFFRDKRDVNIHENPIELKKGIDIGLQEKINISESVSVEVKDSEGNIKDKCFSESCPQNNDLENKPVIKIVYSFDDWSGDEDVLILCKKYLKELNETVIEGKVKRFINQF